MKLLYILLLPFLLIIQHSTAQDTAKHHHLELGADMGAGLSKINVKSDDFNSKFGLNVQGQVYVNYFFTKALGLTLGLGFNQINASTLSHTYSTVVLSATDPTGPYQIIASGEDYLEKQQINLLELPIGFVYKHQLSDKFNLRTSLGLKFGFPQASSYQLDKGLSTRLYYPELMNSEDDAIRNIPDWGLYESYTNWDNNSTLDLNLNLAMFVKAGISYQINQQLALSASLYFSYGLNDPIENTQHQLLSSASNNTYAYHSPSTFTDNNTLDLGLKIGFIYALKGLVHKAHETIATANDYEAELSPKTEIIAQELLEEDSTNNAEPSTAIVPTPSLGIDSSTVVYKKAEPLKHRSATLQSNGALLPEQIALRRDSVIAIVEASKVNFGFESTGIDPALIPRLDKLIPLLIDYDLHLIIEGHSDEQGDTISNMYYSRKRAESVANYLKEGGVSQEQITTIAKGESEPLVKNAIRLVDHKKNRRVVLIVINEDKEKVVF